ncbi:ricin-type beta-trefoil lectin domain protein [Marinobacter sp. 1-3A]|uniref:M66 family metalloprotease n=1 Tax=Marinobacter sp. 1-3A TaxID=2582920 RepID=UPI0019072876|nr:M66 family metalloprotease [Marinobacter sp. 1-3A]MBK1872243.1 ricin-type beta-trefoil lectin domain protein [Marinobacter sp. 1-3A]
MYFRGAAALGLTAILLSGCGGSSSSKTITESRHSVSFPDAISMVSYQYQPKHEALPGNVRYSGYNLPDWASVDARTGIISGTPGPEHASAQVELSIAASNDSHRLILMDTIKVEHAGAFLSPPALDFYAKDFDGNPREPRNDLSGGELEGEVQFVQSHSVAPANNFERNTTDETKSKYMPRLTALRDTLLLFVPNNGIEPITMHAEVSVNGQPLLTLPMAHPNDLPKSDVAGAQPIQYSTKAWSVNLPWDTVKNGLSLEFIVDKDVESRVSGYLPAADIDIGEASRIVFQSIRLGMLTEPGQSNGHYTLRDPVLAATDYFQTLPVSKLVMGSYADAVLNRVIIRSGTIYDKDIDGSSQVEGNVYSGDMRENVGKSQVSVGINMANFGYTSNNMNQQHPHVFKQITNHHAWGMYTNGRVGHGLSGGNGIGTLYDSRGNEASHEWGHAYGLGHYPGRGLTDDGRWAVHHADSGWGYIAHRNRMRANLFGLNDEGAYNYKRDAMSGGSDGGPFSVYTHYTGYTARIIQNDLASLPIPDTSYPDGYKKWNTTTGQFENHASSHPAPVAVGVAVATILGGYDPDGTNAVIYPVFHGNYGNLFDLPEPDLNSSANQCWVEVNNRKGEQKHISVASSRHSQNSINQLHFNLRADFKPTSASLYCRRNGTDEKLTETSFSGEIPELPPVAIVGQEAGHHQLRTKEIAEIEDKLNAMDPASFNTLSGDLAVQVASYTERELKGGLSGPAWRLLQKIKRDQELTTEIAVIIAKARLENLSSEETKYRLMQSLTASGLIESIDDLLLTGDVIQGNNVYFDTNLVDAKYIAVTTVPADIANASHWVMDLKNRIHPVATPWQCLTPSGERLELALCQQDNAAQRWTYTPDTQLLRNEGNGKCVDYARHNGTLITYGCSGNWNQQWAGVITSENKLLSLLDGNLLAEVYGVILAD